ncbi:aldehyde-activating protein [Croceicoccus estronivorus]|uniref:GFA family protein n=1 Tax=Croceicoccus estronivorus TaxID=1172626 RepID=UPI0008376555|nr:GFA family protein [Croceicoccus estronivorus]OCC24032.1 aldehyde-activating protein [Croceicoccus estronivorus]
MSQEGGCQCGAVRYQITGEAEHSAVCHCADCQASSGAPIVAWLAVKEDRLTLKQGAPATYHGKNGAERQFCPNCGTGLFYRNANILPGIVDIQSATLDDAAAAAPSIQIQCAERLPWVTGLNNLPEFERYPGP